MTQMLDSSVVLGLPEHSLLGAFNRAGVLGPADIHVARRLSRLGGDDDELVTLGAAFAVRAPRVGHVRADLLTVRASAEAEEEGGEEAGEANDADEAERLESLPWPDPEPWLSRLAASPLVAVGDADPAVAPLRLVGSALYLDRYWRDERELAADLRSRVASSVLARAGGAPGVATLAAAIGRLFAEDGDREQRWAVAAGAVRGLAVIAGGPGTGKTTTVARLIGALAEEACGTGAEMPLVALVAPTGKAAHRMQEAVRAAATGLDLSPAARQHLSTLGASTVHRLLRPRPENASRFRYHRRNLLPHDVVVVDETSMLSLWLMTRLVGAVRPGARLVLVGDPEQLASVEAGAVLGDIVGPASGGLRMREASLDEVAAVAGMAAPAQAVPQAAPAIGDGVVVLRTNHRFGGALADLAEAIRSGDADAAVDLLGSAGDASGVGWLPVDAGDAEPDQLEPIRRLACDAAARVLEAARAGDAEAALAALASFRILCAHRRGPAGVSMWNGNVEEWLAEEVAGHATGAEWYLGRPVIVTANDYSLRLFNGDTGVLVDRGPAGAVVAFEHAAVSPSRLPGVETVYAMTIHKAQGSEFDRVAVTLPRPTSRILTRELLYTAVTRARGRLLLAGTEESVRAAIDRPIARASGLTERLWGGRP